MAVSIEEEIIDTSKKLPETDEFSEEQFMVGDDSETMYDSQPELGDAFEVMSGTTFEQKDNRNERLAVKAVELAKENDRLKVELGAALKTITPGDDGSGKSNGKGNGKPKGAFSKFVQDVGTNLSAIARVIPEKIEEISNDPEKKKNFIRGLEIINASSGLRPIGQAKSPLGAISEGLLKAEKGFIATDIAKLKAEKRERRRYPSSQETLLTDSFKEYRASDKNKLKEFVPISTRYNLVKKIAKNGDELPTGILNKSFSDIKAFLSEVPGGEELYDSLSKKFTSKDYGTKMKLEDQVIFNDLFQAATYQQVVKQVKELYPVSNKDIDTLLKTKGDIGSKPEALMKLIAAEMATKEIYMGSRDLATAYFKEDDLDFEQKSIRGSEQAIAEKLKKENKVTNSSIEELFGKGSAESVTDAGYITAYYYQNLKSQKVEGAGDPYTVFVTAKKQEDKEIDAITDKYKPK